LLFRKLYAKILAKEINMNLGNILKQLRIEKNLTQEELGKMVGLKKAAIHKYESGIVQNMKRATISKLANIFNVSPSYLLGYTDERTLQPTKQENELINLILQLTDEETEELSKFVDYLISKRK
jgi:transcriptional regulator with XRE-family HTH domain